MKEISQSAYNITFKVFLTISIICIPIWLIHYNLFFQISLLFYALAGYCLGESRRLEIFRLKALVMHSEYSSLNRFEMTSVLEALNKQNQDEVLYVYPEDDKRNYLIVQIISENYLVMKAFSKIGEPDCETESLARVYNIEGIKTFNLSEMKSVTYEKSVTGEDKGEFY